MLVVLFLPPRFSEGDLEAFVIESGDMDLGEVVVTLDLGENDLLAMLLVPSVLDDELAGDDGQVEVEVHGHLPDFRCQETSLFLLGLFSLIKENLLFLDLSIDQLSFGVVGVEPLVLFHVDQLGETVLEEVYLLVVLSVDLAGEPEVVDHCLDRVVVVLLKVIRREELSFVQIRELKGLALFSLFLRHFPQHLTLLPMHYHLAILLRHLSLLLESLSLLLQLLLLILVVVLLSALLFVVQLHLDRLLQLQQVLLVGSLVQCQVFSFLYSSDQVPRNRRIQLQSLVHVLVSLFNRRLLLLVVFRSIVLVGLIVIRDGLGRLVLVFLVFQETLGQLEM